MYWFSSLYKHSIRVGGTVGYPFHPSNTPHRPSCRCASVTVFLAAHAAFRLHTFLTIHPPYHQSLVLHLCRHGTNQSLSLVRREIRCRPIDLRSIGLYLGNRDSAEVIRTAANFHSLFSHVFSPFRRCDSTVQRIPTLRAAINRPRLDMKPLWVGRIRSLIYASPPRKPGANLVGGCVASCTISRLLRGHLLALRPLAKPEGSFFIKAGLWRPLRNWTWL